MVEYGPFIEYCCELYVHHTVLNAVVGGVIVLAAVVILGIGIIAYKYSKRRT